MFLVDCPIQGTRHLQSTRSIIAHRSTTQGDLTVLACRCGGHAVMLNGAQRVHRGPDELPGSDTSASTNAPTVTPLPTPANPTTPDHQVAAA